MRQERSKDEQGEFDEQFAIQKATIIYGAAIDEFTGKYVPTGQIVWHTVKSKHGTHSFTLSKLFSTADDAKTVAVEQRTRGLMSVSPLEMRSK